MKKITAVISAIATAAVIAVSASAANIPLERLSGSISDIRNDELVITAALNSSRTVKNHLILQGVEALIVPAGCKLTLKEGCTVFGTLYIEEGGYLAVSGGSLDICGAVVSDGTVSIGSKAALSVAEKGELFVSASGEFKSKTEHISFDENSSVACLGKTAVSGGYYLAQENPVGGYSEVLTLVFDNGSTVQITHRGDKVYNIGSAHISALLKYFAEDYPNTNSFVQE